MTDKIVIDKVVVEGEYKTAGAYGGYLYSISIWTADKKFIDYSSPNNFEEILESLEKIAADTKLLHTGNKIGVEFKGKFWGSDIELVKERINLKLYNPQYDVDATGRV